MGQSFAATSSQWLKWQPGLERKRTIFGTQHCNLNPTSATSYLYCPGLYLNQALVPHGKNVNDISSLTKLLSDMSYM